MQRRRMVVAILAAGVFSLALAGCAAGDGSPDASGDPNHDAQVDETTGAENDGPTDLGNVTVTLDGVETGPWDTAFCTEVDADTFITSDTDDGGDLMWTVSGRGTPGAVFLTPPGETTELVNHQPGQTQATDTGFTFTGTLSDDFHAPTVEVEAHIEVDCGAA